MQDISVGPKASVPDQVTGIGQGKQVFTSGKWTVVDLRHFCVSVVIQRVNRLFVPFQTIGFKSLGISQRGFDVEAGIGVHGKVATVSNDLQGSFDAA